jgi:hypothetical protein
MIKLLTAGDINLLNDFFEESKLTDLSIRISELEAWKFYLDKLSKPNSGCLIFASIEDNKIVRAYFTMTADCLFDIKIKVFPYWISTLVRTLVHTSSPAEGFEELYEAGVKEYESRGYNTFYNVVQIPKNYNHSQINRYLIRAYEKVIGKAINYEYLLDTIIEDPDSYDGFRLFKLIIPKNIPETKKVLVVRHELKTDLRK